jgi:23S rRNA (adenine2503-C2)-methyltransferase
MTSLEPPDRITMILKNLTTDDIIATGVNPRVARRIQTMVVKYRAETLPDRLEHVARTTWNELRSKIQIPQIATVERVVARSDGFAKYLFETPGLSGRYESVQIPILHRPEQEKYIVCVSSQVGCGVGCAFCATGRMGFKRNLETWEMVDQVLKVQQDCEFPVRGVVFMGMGEPLLNYDNVVRACRILSDPSGGAIDAKSLTVSTAGVVPMIERWTREKLPFRLITSLHAATTDLRNELVPLNRNYPIHKVMTALKGYQDVMRRRVVLAWTMIPGINMNREQAVELKRITEGLRFVLDLIPVNDTTGRYRAPEREEISDFLNIIKAEVDCPIVIRYSGGKDVNGACGMLAGEKSAPNRHDEVSTASSVHPN